MALHLIRRVPTLRSVVRQQTAAFSMATIFAEPAFPMPKKKKNSREVAKEDTHQWMRDMAQADVTGLWKIGAMPLVPATKTTGALVDSNALNPSMIWTTRQNKSSVFDREELLTGLEQDCFPERVELLPREGTSYSLGELLDALEEDAEGPESESGMLADSVLKKRRKKMNKHKYRKRKKALRMRTKKT